MESFLTRTFEHAGQIKKTYIGHYKPKANKKK